MVTKKGFTLIEILVVISVLAIIMVIGSSSFFNLLKGSTKTRTANLVKQNGDYALAVMERMIRNAQDIDAANCTLGMDEITIVNPDGKSTVFSCIDNPISSNSAKLISDQVIVDDCLFDCQDGGYFDPDVVTIDFTLSTGDPTQPEEYTTVNFKTTVVLRNIAGYE